MTPGLASTSLEAAQCTLQALHASTIVSRDDYCSNQASGDHLPVSFLQEFAELTANRKATASALHADAAPDISAGSGDSSDTDDAAADFERDQPDNSAEEAARHAAMLADVRGPASDRKRKRAVVMSEAYPDSEYNLPPTGAAGNDTPARLAVQTLVAECVVNL